LFQGCLDEKVSFQGNDISDQQTSSEFSCQQKCQENALCKFWTWSSENKKCFLQDQNALHERKVDSDYISGTPTCPGKSFKNV
jgi:hypothetical protein